MSSIKQKVKRKVVKLHRRVSGKPKEIMITTGEGGLTKSEIEDVLNTLSLAGKQGKVPAMSYEYTPPSIFVKREELRLIPKTVSVATARVKVRALLAQKYKGKYIIDNPPSVAKPTRLPSTRRTRITPERPPIR